MASDRTTGAPASGGPRGSGSRRRRAVAAGLALALLAGAAALAWQDHRARVTHEEAQRGLDSVLALSRTLHVGAPGPGPADARRLLNRIAAVMEGLPRDARVDRHLTEALSSAYRPLADAGAARPGGDAADAGAIVGELRRAAAVVDAWHIDEPEDPHLLTLAVRLHADLAALLTKAGDPGAPEAREVHAALVRELEALRLDDRGRRRDGR
ncbi:MAG: hypothetical protein AB7O28_02140 [Vicinamibacterales bacterium]